MKGLQLQAQVLGLDHSPHSAQKYSATERLLNRTQEQCLRHFSQVALNKTSALLRHTITVT